MLTGLVLLFFLGLMKVLLLKHLTSTGKSDSKPKSILPSQSRLPSRIITNRKALVQKDNHRWQYILGRTVRLFKKSHWKWEFKFGSRMVEFEYLAQAFVMTLLPGECAKTVFLLSQKSPSWIQTKETVSSLLGRVSKQSVVIQDHTSQDHFCSVINEFPVWNSKSVTPRWWDSTSCPERDTGFGSQVRNHRWSLARVPASAMDVK